MRDKLRRMLPDIVGTVMAAALFALFIFCWFLIGACADDPPSPAYEEYLQQMDEAGIPPNGYWGCKQQRELDKHMTDTGMYKDIYGYGWGE